MRFHGWLVAMALLTCVTTDPASGRSTDQTAVLRAAKQFGAAVAGNDTHAIASLTDEDWQIIDGDGHIISRAAFLRVIASDTLKHTSLSDFDQTVRTYGNAAVVTARSRVRERTQEALFPPMKSRQTCGFERTIAGAAC